MTRYLYKAKNNKGQIVTGTVKAQNEVEAEKVLIKHNLVATELIAEQQTSFSAAFAKRVSVKDRSVFTRQLATMLSAGLSLSKAISILAKQAKNDLQRKIFLDIYKELEQGYSLSSALAKHPEAFDRVYVSVVNSGESTGKLDVVLNELANQLENDSNFVNKVKSSLYYPGFIFVVLILAGIFMLTFVIPKLRSMFDQAGQELPILTKILLAMSGFMQNWWWLVILLMVGGAIMFKYWSITEGGARTIQSFQLSVPGLKTIFEGVYMYRFTRIMSMLISAGVPLLDALKIGSAVIDNVVYEEAIARVASQVEKGVPLSSQLLKEEVFPPIIGNMVSVGEETGELDKVLDKVSVYYEQATNDLTKAISSLVEPMILIIVGAAVAFIVFAIYLPIYQINSNVS